MNDEPIRILYIDDSAFDRALVRDALERHAAAFELVEAGARAEFEERLGARAYDVVLSDMNMPGFDGLQVLDRVKSLAPDMPVVIVTGAEGEEAAVEAMKRGALHYVIKSWQQIRKLPLVLQGAHEQHRLLREKRRSEDRLRRVARARFVMAQCNRVLVRAGDERQLFQDMCRIVVESGGHRMAWIGIARQDAERTIEPVASFGDHDQLLSRVRISWADDEFGQGPAGRAVRTGEPQIIRDVEQSAAYRWRQEAVAGGHRALASLPLSCAGTTLGVLGLLPSEPDAFDAEEIELLKELADDIGYGVHALRARAAQHEAEAALRASEARFQSTFAQVAVGLAHVDFSGRFLLVNDRLCAIFGYGREEILGQSFQKLTVPEDLAHSLASVQQVVTGALPSVTVEKRCLRKDGSMFWTSVTASLGKDGQGDSRYVIVAVEDIDERKQADIGLREYNARLAAIVDAHLYAAGSGDGDLSALLQIMLHKVCEVLKADAAGIQMLEGERLVFTVATDSIRHLIGCSNGLEDSIAGTAVRTGLVQVSADTLIDERVDPAAAGRSGARSAIVAPLQHGARVHGVLKVFSTQPDRFRDAEVSAVQLFAGIAGHAIERKRAELALREAVTFTRSTLDALSSHICVIDNSGTIVEVNRNWRDFALRNPGRPEAVLTGANFLRACDEAAQAGVEVAGRFAQALRELLAGARHEFAIEYEVQSAEGQRWFLLRATRFPEGGGRAYAVLDHEDVSERVRRTRRQAVIAAFSQRALESMDTEALLHHAVSAVIEGTDPEFCRLLQVAGDEQRLMYKAGRRWTPEGGQQECLLSAPMRPPSARTYEPVLVEDLAPEHGPDPSRAPPGIRSGIEVPIANASGLLGVLGVYAARPACFGSEHVDFLQSVSNIVATAMDRRSTEQRLAHLAQFDALTGLPNRNLFKDRLHQALSQAQRNHWLVGLLFIDLDRFKTVNDTLGHNAGDVLLVHIAESLQSCVRSGDTVGRLGGDEFVIILSNLAKPDDVSGIAHKVLATLSQSVDVLGHRVYVTASVGIALYPGDGANADELLKNADTAMFRAKEQGRNSLRFYLPSMNARAVERVQLESELRGAYERGEFRLVYQPRVSLATGRISGLEALLRWDSPSRGEVPPSDFIPILEDTGLIMPVGDWVLRAACAQVAAWCAMGLAIPVAVNLSARQFAQKGLDEAVRRIVRDAGIAPELLELELTESMLMQDAEEAARVLSNLKALGVKLSIDDFGTGYSSLAYLKRFPIDSLKVDRAFVRDCTTDPDDAAIVLAVVNLGHSLKLRVIAEGVETEAQMNFLRAKRCDEMQGFLFARPMKPEDCTRMLQEGRRLAGLPAPGAPRAVSVLLVDDDPDDLLLMEAALHAGPYRVIKATHCKAAFEALARQQIDMVVCDHGMPDMPGVQFLTSVRELYPEVVRLMVTGSRDPHVFADAVNHGCVHMLVPKTAGMGELSHALEEAWSRFIGP
jgi:diguanylate cyclase (GGDEF)-like protein/PAS domain S-box-containing protein